MAKDFISHLPARITEMQNALQKVDAHALSRAAHNLKGMAATFASETLTQLTETLESDSANGKLENAAELITAIDQERQKIETFFAGRGILPHAD